MVQKKKKKEEAKCFIYRVFRNMWDPLRELIVRLKIMKKNRINVCPVFVYEIQ